MRTFCILVNAFTNIMHQTSPFCNFRVKVKFNSHYSAKHRHFN